MNILLGCAVSLCAVFGASLTSKAGRGSFRAFATSPLLTQFPRRWRTRLAAAAVTAETAVLAGLVTCLFIPWWTTLRPSALYVFIAAALLLATFTVVIVMALRRGDRAPCRCFGAAQEPLGSGHVARNLLLLTVAVVGGGTAALVEPAAVQPAGALVATLAGLVGGLFAVRFDDLLHLMSPRPPRSSASP